MGWRWGCKDCWFWIWIILFECTWGIWIRSWLINTWVIDLRCDWSEIELIGLTVFGLDAREVSMYIYSVNHHIKHPVNYFQNEIPRHHLASFQLCQADARIFHFENNCRAVWCVCRAQAVLNTFSLVTLSTINYSQR